LEGERVDDKVREFLEKYHDCLMTSLKKDGMPHVARVSVGLVDGKLWSSGTNTRVRTKHLRRDPRSTLMILGGNRWEWLGLETEVEIIDDGDGTIPQNLALYRVIAGKDPDDMADYERGMRDEERIVYQFNIKRTYGMH
jgi:PPOX class probable F420-dependent enzyme